MENTSDRLGHILAKGYKFSSFEALSEAVHNWEVKNFVQLYKRSSRFIQARFHNKHYNENLKYSEIDYACIHGGRKAGSRSTGKRPNQKFVA